ncbi:MAG: insulinase family protein [candidate division Zixibacteria bacterium]|nr:insulinase family protein [candidate division Zixibacteria bacterium]
MRRGRIFSRLFIVIITISLIVSMVSAKTTRMTFENGMEVIFKENHSSPMITSIVFIRAGAKYENDFNNGITHFLEHLLFDGTKNRSRLEISEGIDNHGGYINAFTRKDLTAFLVLTPKEHFEYGIEIQADQLFNSIFPDVELPKERKVVIEEIQKDNDNEAGKAYDFFNAKSMAGTAYERTVLGYKNIIASIPRENIINYWKQFYAPNNMIALVIGDFDTEEMIETYKSVFGVIPPVDTPPPPDVSYNPPLEKKVYKKAGKAKQTYINIGIDAPHFTDPDWYAFDLMCEYLNSDEYSPLLKALSDSDGKQLYQSFSVSVETQEEFSRLLIDVITDDESKSERIIAGVESVLQNFDEHKPSAEILEGIITSKKVNEIFMEEKLHYYGFVIAPLLVTTGYDFLESYLEVIEKVNPTMIVRAADRWLDDLKYIATVYHPKQVVSKAEEEKRFTVYKKEVLENGLTLIVKSNPDSRVFALNVIGKNRSASESAGKTGITDFVNRMIKKGTETYSSEELSKKLDGIGAKVTLCDNPWIPYDDRYTTRQYSFMKFETIDEFTGEGLSLFSDMIMNPAFNETDIEKIRGMLMGVIGRQSGSTLNTCRGLFYANLFKGQAFAKSINGSPRTVGTITRDDLVTYHSSFYSPGNMIITVGTNFDADTMMAMLTNVFEEMLPTASASVPAQNGTPIIGVKTAHKEMDKEQVYIFLGNKLPGANHQDAMAIRLAVSILSDRLGKTLREEQGLAYSVGAGAGFDKEFGWYACTMGTGAKNFIIARDGILNEIGKLQTNGPSAKELEIAKNSLWGSTLTRQLSRINQAYYMGVNEYLGRGYDYYDKFSEKMRATTLEQVKAAANKYLDTQNYVLTTAGKLN